MATKSSNKKGVKRQKEAGGPRPPPRQKYIKLLGPDGVRKTSDELKALVFPPLKTSEDAQVIAKDFFLALKYDTATGIEPDLTWSEKLYQLFGVKFRSVLFYKVHADFQMPGAIVEQANPKLLKKVPSRKVPAGSLLIVRVDLRTSDLVDLQVLSSFVDENDAAWFRLKTPEWTRISERNCWRLSKEELREDSKYG